MVKTAIRRGEVYLVNLDPTRGSEIRKPRPCVIVSPDELNQHLRSFIVAPLTSGHHDYSFRQTCTFQGRSGSIVLDQIRTVDEERLIRRLGRLSQPSLESALNILLEMFAI